MARNKKAEFYVPGLHMPGITDVYMVTTSGPGSGWQRGRIPARMGRCMLAGWPGFVWFRRADGSIKSVEKTAVYRNGRYYLRNAAKVVAS